MQAQVKQKRVLKVSDRRRRQAYGGTYMPSASRYVQRRTPMGKALVRRRHSAFAAGLATLAMALGFTAVPAEAAPREQVDYVALGDSYTAGTGAGAFVPTSPCVQTEYGYVDIVKRTASVNLVSNAACHGAFIEYIDPAFNVPSLQQQIGAVTAAEELTRDTDLVSLTAGANDAGVNSTLFVCATSTFEACKQAVAASVKTMPLVGLKLSKALASIHRVAPGAKIAVLGYPKLFDPLGLPIIPPSNQVLVNQGTALLNATIAASVASANTFHRANAQYIDVTKSFRGHAVNDGESSWIFFNPNPILDQNGNPIADPRNFHPNPAGHLAYASALTEAVDLTALARR
jgi:lysophospholipase L1-like esterase